MSEETVVTGPFLCDAYVLHEGQSPQKNILILNVAKKGDEICHTNSLNESFKPNGCKIIFLIDDGKCNDLNIPVGSALSYDSITMNFNVVDRQTMIDAVEETY